MRMISPIWASAGALTCALTVSACGQTSTAPSRTLAPSVADTTSASSSPEDFAARGWDCRPAPTNPIRVTCSPPNQGHPVLLPGPPPPADRPETFTLLVFDSGVFIGTDLLIRSDLYQGQPCHSSGGPYRFIARIGYYECLRLVGGG